MNGLYLFATAAGVPLVAWFLLSGGDEGGDDGGGDDGIGGIMLRLFPLSTLALALAAFGVTGLALGAVATSAATTFVVALVAGAIGGVLNSTVFSYLRRSESGAAVDETQLAGTIGRVVLPIAENRRGRVAVSVSGQQIYLSARTLPDIASADDEFEVGASVLVVEVRDGIAAAIRLDPELA